MGIRAWIDRLIERVFGPWPGQRSFLLTVSNARGEELIGYLIPDAHPPIEGVWVHRWAVRFDVPKAVREGASVQVWPRRGFGAVHYGRARFGGLSVDQIGGLPRVDAEMDEIVLSWPDELFGLLQS